jgi:hypothetical protein
MPPFKSTNDFPMFELVDHPVIVKSSINFTDKETEADIPVLLWVYITLNNDAKWSPDLTESEALFYV